MNNPIKTHEFALRDQFWIDAGIAGLYNIAMSHNIADKHKVAVSVDSEKLSIQYEEEEQLHCFLKDCYETLANLYWNVSNKKQREEEKAVFYNPITDELFRKPKRNPTPIPALFTKGSSWRLPESASAIPFNHLDSALQTRVEDFLAQTKTKLWGNKKYLLLKDPVCHKQLEILPIPKKKTDVCSVCGQVSSSLSSVSQPAYLLFASDTAAKSFNSEAGPPDKICWECEFLSKFAVDSASYRKEYEDLYIIQIVSPSLIKIINASEKIGSASVMRKMDLDMYYSNIRQEETGLIRYARLPHEFLWTFFYDTYNLVRNDWQARQVEDEGDWLQELVELSLKDSPLQVVLLVISNKGQTFITKDLIFFNDTAYVYRLIDYMHRNDIDLKSVFYNLLNRVDKDRPNDFRNRFCHKVLHKRSVVQETEKFAFHTAMLGESGQIPYLKEIIAFLKSYEIMIGGINMNAEQVEVAVNLGKQVVMGANKVLKSEEFKKIKSDLFILRKTRTKADFLAQLNNLQLRYGLIISGQIADGLMEEVPFEEFKAYCMLGALNTFNIKNRGGQENE